MARHYKVKSRFKPCLIFEHWRPAVEFTEIYTKECKNFAASLKKMPSWSRTSVDNYLMKVNATSDLYIGH